MRISPLTQVMWIYFPASRIPKLLHHLVKPIYRSTSTASRESSKSRGNLKEKGFRIVMEPSTLSSVLQWTSDSEVALLALCAVSVSEKIVSIIAQVLSPGLGNYML